MKFININQQFYESQKNITKKITDIIILTNRDNSETKELLKVIKNTEDDTNKIIKDVSGKQVKIITDIKILSDIRKELHGHVSSEHSKKRE